MHHVERGAGYAFGEAQNAAEAQILRELIVDFGEMLEADAALTNELGVHVHDDVVIFRMDDAEPALLRQHLKRLPDIAEIDHAAGARRQDIGGEYFQRRITGLNCLRELAGEFRRRLGMQHDVVGPVAGAFADKVLIARLDGLERRDTAAPVGEIDECSRAAVERRATDLLWPSRDQGRAVRLGPLVMKMHVRVDAARHDNVSGSIDHPRSGFGRERVSGRDRSDRLTGDSNIATHDTVRRYNIAAANDEIEHCFFPRLAERFASRS